LMLLAKTMATEVFYSPKTGVKAGSIVARSEE